MEFKEEYWPDALSTLRREERKAFLKRWAPWLGVLLLLGGSAVGYGLYSQTDGPALAQRGNPAALTVELGQVWTPPEASAALPAPSSDAALTASAPTAARPQASDASSAQPADASTDAAPTAPVAAAQPTASPVSPDTPTSQPGAPLPASASDIAASLAAASRTATPEVANTPDPEAATPASSPATEDPRAQLPANALTLRTAMLQPESAPVVAPFYIGNPLVAKPARVMGTAAPVAATPSKRPLAEMPFPWKQSGFNMSVGTSLMTGFGSRRGQYVFNPEVGVGYEYVSPDPHWSVRGSLNYFQIGGIAHAASFDQLEAGFGLTTTRTTIQTERLHFAYVPVEVFWNATRRFSLSGGAGVSYLVNGLSEVVVSRFDHDASTELDRFEDWGYVGGYRSLNASLLAGAEWRPNTRWILGTQYQHGLTRITKESVYGQTKQDRNSRLRVYLKFAL